MMAVNFNFPDLHGRRILVTGIARGIGRALVPILTQQGLRVIGVDRKMEDLVATRESLGLTENNLELFACDLANPAAVKELSENLAATATSLDGILHNAAIDPRHRFEQTEDHFWSEVLQINLLSAVTLTRHLLPHLRKSPQGRIIFTGSVLSELGGACLTAYSASKGAVTATTRALAHELKGTSITVNCILPGAIRVEKEVAGADETLIDWQSVPRRLEPADLAGMLCLLLSEAGGGITGQSITIDGGIVHPIASPEVQGRTLA